MRDADVEQIARTVVRDYGLPLKFGAVSTERPGHCTVGFLDSHSGETLSVGVWCDGKATPHHVRESLKRALSVSD